ncbi:MAG TPA: hypothetical protein VMA37_05510 [Acetobacteraceae bacterium]|nr:hypothetical protein [Acetobacteraceae bacterium]
MALIVFARSARSVDEGFDHAIGIIQGAGRSGRQSERLTRNQEPAGAPPRNQTAKAGSDCVCERTRGKKQARNSFRNRSILIPGALALLSTSFLLSGCGAVVLGALGGTGVVTYASTTNDKATQTAAVDPPPDPPNDPPALPTSTFDSSEIRNSQIGTQAEAYERPGPGANSRPNTAENSLPSTIAANYPYNQIYNPPNPFVANEIPRPIPLIGLPADTNFTVQAQTNNRSVILRSPQ